MKEDHRPRGIWLRYKTQVAMNWVRDEFGMGRFHPSDFEVNHIPVKIRGLDPAFAGYRLVQISDIHLGQWMTPDRLNGVVDLVNQQAPDSVVITGDYFSWNVGEFTLPLVDSLRRIKSRDGVYSILGNHDHWVGASQIREILRDSNIVELCNSVKVLHRGNGLVYIAGLDDVMVGQDKLDPVLEQLGPPGPAILLVHEPDFAEKSASTGRFNLELSGHSHGGQLVLPGLGPIVRGEGFKKYPLGLYNINGMVHYTNRGLGTNVFWFRVNCPPEIAVFHLQPG